MTTALRAALYLRVSTGRQADNDLSIPDQHRQAKAYCASRGWEIVANYVEPGASATDDRRPEFQRMIDAATTKPPAFEVIVVHSFSRFFRDQFQLEFYVRRLAKNGVRLVSITQELGDDPMSNMIRQIMAKGQGLPKKRGDEMLGIKSSPDAPPCKKGIMKPQSSLMTCNVRKLRSAGVRGRFFIAGRGADMRTILTLVFSCIALPAFAQSKLPRPEIIDERDGPSWSRVLEDIRSLIQEALPFDRSTIGTLCASVGVMVVIYVFTVSLRMRDAQHEARLNESEPQPHRDEPRMAQASPPPPYKRPEPWAHGEELQFREVPDTPQPSQALMPRHAPADYKPNVPQTPQSQPQPVPEYAPKNYRPWGAEKVGAEPIFQRMPWWDRLAGSLNTATKLGLVAMCLSLGWFAYWLWYLSSNGIVPATDLNQFLHCYVLSTQMCDFLTLGMRMDGRPSHNIMYFWMPFVFTVASYIWGRVKQTQV